MELIGKQIAIETILGQPPELHYPSWYAAQIEKLPPAPPEYLAEQAGILVTDSDTISRQAAIDAICNACGKIDCDKMDKCEKLQLPPANCSEFPNNSDTISRRAAIEAILAIKDYGNSDRANALGLAECAITTLPSAQPTLYGYNIEHLKLIATVLREEDLPPERVAEALTDTGRIVAIVMNEFEKALRKAVEQCTT